MCKHFFWVVRIILAQSKSVHIYNFLSAPPYTLPPLVAFYAAYSFLYICPFFSYASVLVERVGCAKLCERLERVEIEANRSESKRILCHNAIIML